MAKTRGIAIAIPSRDPIPERAQVEQPTIVETLSPPERQDKHRKIKTSKRRIRAHRVENIGSIMSTFIASRTG